MAKTTIVSLLPWPLREEKPGQFPGIYAIPEAERDSFSITYIEEAYYLELVPFADEKTPPRQIPILSENVARGLVEDYERAQLATSYDLERFEGSKAQALPGLFFLPGAITREEVKTKHAERLIKASLNQSLWFSKLVKIADDDWARYGRHNVISDMQRNACRWLKLERPWDFNVLKAEEQKACKFCFSILHPKAVVCSNCKEVVDPEAYKKMKAAVA